jgi:hypothetical protein
MVLLVLKLFISSHPLELWRCPMHWCFATPWETSWIPLCYVLYMLETNNWLSMQYYSWSFVCVTFHVVTWLLSSIVLMLHACFTPIALCFVYTSRHFYAFSKINLLTRCHSASSLFSAIFVFQKSYIGNILRIGRNESQSSYFPQHETESKAETKEGQEVATPPSGAGPPLATLPPGVGPLVPSDIAPLPI